MYGEANKCQAIGRGDVPVQTLASAIDALRPMIEVIHDLASRYGSISDSLIGPSPQDAADRAQPPADNNAPVALRIERVREELQWAIERLAGPLKRLEGRV
jgi:hypothetical protein